MNYQAVLEKLRQHALMVFETNSGRMLVYHGRAHTEGVVTAAMEIGNHYQLNERDFFVVVAAAWLHDIGYFIDASCHEQKGADRAAELLKEQEVPADVIEDVKNCILATRMPQKPVGLLQEIVCDADLYHFGTDAFAEKNKLMRKEYRQVHEKEIDKESWRLSTIRLLEQHHFHTDYCRMLLDEKKQQNLEKLRRKAADVAKKEHPAPAPVKETPAVTAVTAETLLPADKAGKGKKATEKRRPDRGIETMFRITSANHQRLSDMADSKAHIMITVNSIIISVLLSVLLRKLEEYPHLTFPALLLLSVNLITIIFSILATRPNIPRGTFTADDIKGKRVNLLFFGNFYRMSLEDYTSGMLNMMEDRDFLYGSLIRDVYSQGVVLGRKYRMLRVSYNVFMFGLVAAVVAFVVASVLYTT